MKRASEAKAERERIRRELATELRRSDREKLSELRRRIADAKTAKKSGLVSARESCRSAREAVRARAKAARAELTAAIAAERSAARGACAAGRERAKESGTKRVSSARHELGEERSAQRTRRLYEKPPKLHAGSKSSGGRRTAELRAESDDDVRGNLPPELVAVFDSVRRSIQATPKRSRTETFLEWATEHPERVWQITERRIAEDLRKLEAEEREHFKATRHPRRYKRPAAELEASLADVPF